MNRWLSLLGFLVLVIGGGLAIGYVTAPGEWYAGLAKPSRVDDIRAVVDAAGS